MTVATKTIRPTITSIAKKLELSHSTVSLVLNGRGDEIGIKPATQKRILDEAKKVNYVPNSLAQNLRNNKTNTIGVLWSLGRPEAEGMLELITNRLWENGYSTRLVPSLSDPKLIPKALDEMAKNQVDGIIFQASGSLIDNREIISRLDMFNVVVAVTDEVTKAVYNLVMRDTSTTIKQVVDYFAFTGKKRPCLLTLSGNSSQSKLFPFLERLSYHGFSVDNAILDAGGLKGETHRTFDYLDLIKAYLEKTFPKDFPYDAIQCGNDDTAAAALLHMRELGKRVPEDVAIVGFDNRDLLRAADPPIASINWDYKEAADAVNKLLFEQLEDPSRPKQNVNIPTHFYWRKSAGTIPPKSHARNERSERSKWTNDLSGTGVPGGTGVSPVKNGSAGVPPAVPAQQETIALLTSDFNSAAPNQTFQTPDRGFHCQAKFNS